MGTACPVPRAWVQADATAVVTKENDDYGVGLETTIGDATVSVAATWLMRWVVMLISAFPPLLERRKNMGDGEGGLFCTIWETKRQT